MTAPTTGAFLDYFRCPGHLAVFETAGNLSAEEGYYRFRDAVCYGRQAAGAPSPRFNGSLTDVSRFTKCDLGRVRLPFDLADVVTNLRYERYRQPSPGALERITASSAAHAIYYLLRPALPVGVRKHLQRIRLSGWEGIPFPRWPVDVTVETLMKDAAGLVQKAGHDQVADQYAPFSQPLFIKFERPHLAVHLFDRPPGGLGVKLDFYFLFQH